MPKTTNAEREQRLIELDKHNEELDFQGKDYSKQDQLDYLKSKGFEIDKQTLLRDIEELSSNNNFVANIGMHYSKYMENISKTYDRIEREGWKIYDKVWTQSKSVKKQALDRNGKIRDLNEVVITKEIAGPNLGALKLIAEITKSRQELASGKNLEVSAAMWVKKEKELQEEIKQLKSKLSKEKEMIIPGDKIITN